MAEIDPGRPVATGWLHKGPVSAPTGGGHWTVVVGYTDSQWIHHDPNGEAALVGGGYTASTNGEGQHYSFQNWNPRWMPGGTGGWFLFQNWNPRWMPGGTGGWFLTVRP